MTYGSILRTCILCLACVANVLAAILAAHSHGTVSPTAEQASFTSPTSDDDIAVVVDNHLAAIPMPPTNQETLSGFERYIAGLGRLSEALLDTGRDWEASAHVLFSTPGQHGHETDFRDQVQKLFAFAGTVERHIGKVMQDYPSDDEAEIQDNGKREDPAGVSIGTEVASSRSLHTALTTTVTDLLRLFDMYFGRQSVNDENVSEEEGKKEENMDNIQLLADTLEALAEAHTNYTAAINAVRSSVMANSSTGYKDRISNSSSMPLNSSSSVNLQEDSVTAANTTTLPAAAWRPLGWYDNQRGLLQVATQLKALLGTKTLGVNGSDTVPSSTVKADTISTTTSTTTTTTATTTTTTVTPRRKDEIPREQPCLPPFEQIAYRMCILQEIHLKLSWNDAQEFCRERGAELAQDMTVIKMRRFLNDLYGEDGTRSRWPVWVGGQRAPEQQTWRWAGLPGDLEVPSFLWAPNEPRVYSSNLAPKGVCMILDGYRRFHGASLPCHLRRRFVCELQN